VLPITKEKVLFFISTLIAVFVLSSCRIPTIQPVEPVPAEEAPGVYTSAPGTARPQLTPEQAFSSGRDPFRVKDPWSTAPPALLAVPPARLWPRAVPGGITTLPASVNDRLLIDRAALEGGQ
jgi:hypothetical protein